MKLPKYHLLYFKNLLDIAFTKFFDEYNSLFIKDADTYVLSKTFSITELEKFFNRVIMQELNKIVHPYDIIANPDYYVIIGACQPKNNFLLKFKDGYFPAKLEKMINSDYSIKYLLKEKDIIIDTLKFNEACINVFNKFFNDQIYSKKYNYQNVIFIKHNQLDCYSMFKVLKCIFGKTNCINIFVERYNKVNSPIIAVNDLIDKYINQKLKANKDPQFKRIFIDVKQFIQLRIKN